MENNNAVAIREAQMYAPMTAETMRAQVNLIQQIMNEVMQDGQHYGTIPGCGKKPALLKPGAEKIFLTFRLRPIINPNVDITITELPNGHRDYLVYCHIMSMDGVEMATGVGSASTMESKHRYRGGLKIETDKAVPKAYWDLKKEGKTKEAQALIGGPGFGTTKGESGWVICEMGEKMENPDIADQYNTVLKMACKRAKVDGCLSATACSDIFTQDIEDFANGDTPPAKQETKKETATNTAPPQRKSSDAAINKQTGNVFTATGLVTRQGVANKGGYVNFAIAGQVDEQGKDLRLSTKDPIIIETLADRKANGVPVSVDVSKTIDGEFTNYSIIGIISVAEEQQPGD